MGRRPRPFGLTPEQEYKYLTGELNRYRILNFVITCTVIIGLVALIILLEN